MTTNPRTRVVVYLVLTFALSAVPYTLCIRNGLRGTYIFGLMWCPAVAALLASLLTGRSLAEVGWRPGGARYLLAGWWVPMAYS